MKKSKERSSALPLFLSVVAIGKGAFGQLSTMVGQLVYVCMYVCMYKQDFALNNPQVLICHKTQPTKYGEVCGWRKVNYTVLVYYTQPSFLG